MISGKSILKSIVAVSIVLFSASWMQAASAPAKSQEEIMKAYIEKYVNRSRKQKLLDVAISVVDMPRSVATIVHEFGHALIQKLLTNDPINIHYGAPEVPNIISSMPGKFGITVHSLNSWNGAFYQPTTDLEDNKGKLIAMIAAGPTAGFISLCVMNSVLNRLGDRHIFNASEDSLETGIALLLYAFKKLGIYRNMIDALLYGFTPINRHSDGDGYRIWEAVGVPKKILDKGVSLCSEKKDFIMNTAHILAMIIFMKYDAPKLKALAQKLNKAKQEQERKKRQDAFDALNKDEMLEAFGKSIHFG
jgi:hypothetical protein